jgi:hypothetical protein
MARDTFIEALMAGVKVDRLRVWNEVPGSHIARTDVRAPEGKIFVVKVIAVGDHPRPRANRRRRRTPIRTRQIGEQS